MDAEGPEFRFAQFALDTRRRELRAGRSVVPLQPRAFDILEHLIRHRNRAVPRDEILHEIYRDRTVSASNVAVQIAAIRTALARAGGEAKLIVTLTGPAYRFTGGIVGDAGAPPAFAPSPAPPPARRKRWLLPAVALPAVAIAIGAAVLLWPHREAAARLSFAVLPFRNITGDATQDFRAAAITDELNADLAYIPAATVIARESAVAYQEKHLPIPEIGRALHVQYIVTGDLGLEDNAWRAHPRLIDAASGAEVWSETLTFPKSQEGELTPTIAAAIATALNAEIDQREVRRATDDDPDAVDLLYEARALLDRDTGKAASAKAEALLRRAVEKQPDFVEALSTLAHILVHKIESDPSALTGAAVAEADSFVARALAAGPANADAMAAKAAALEMEERCPEAEHFAAAAIRVAFSNIHAHMTLRNCAWQQGNLVAAMQHIAALERLDPAASTPPSRRLIMKAHIQLLENRPQDAIDTIRTTAESYPLPFESNADPLQPAVYARLLLAAGLAMTGQTTDARELVREMQPAIANISGWRVFVAYETKAISRHSGTAAIIQALASAGIPAFASESVASSVSCSVDDSDFAPTPSTLPGGGIVRTQEIPPLLKSARPHIIDVSLGVAAMPGAHWVGTTANTAELYQALGREVTRIGGPSTRQPLLVVGDGPFGCNAYLAARHLIQAGFRNVQWYRGGEEAWAMAGQPSEDHRKY